MEHVAKWLDIMRGEALARTTHLPLFRKLYANRAWRLSFLFILAVLAYLPLSLYFPLFVLVVGPLVWGMPHLMASMRFVPQMIQNGQSARASDEKPTSYKWLITAAAISFTIVTVWRIYTDVWNPDVLFEETQSSFIIEIGLALVTALFASIIRPRLAWWKIAMASIMIGALAYLNFLMPLQLAGALILLHNLIAFFYWFAAAKTRTEKWASFMATLLFMAITAGILLGAFDFVYKWMVPAFRFDFFNLHYSTYGRMIVADPMAKRDILFHCVVAYAFGQAMHYFVWLKAVPDQLRGVQAPACFQQSWRSLKKDLGPLGAATGVTICMVGWLAFPLVSFDLWRGVYFACASFHGFFEIAGLSLLGWRRFVV